MTEPTPDTTPKTQTHARSIEPDPVAPPKPQRTLRPLGGHPAGESLLWAGALIAGLGLAPLLLSRLDYPVTQDAARAAQAAAPSWPAEGEPWIWPSSVAMIAWAAGVAVVVLAIASVKLPDLLVASLATVLMVTTARGAWTAIDVVNAQTWWATPPCLICLLAFGLALRALTRSRRQGSGYINGGPVGGVLRTWLAVLVIFVAGSAIATEAAKSANAATAHTVDAVSAGLVR